ncbi:hypothetical protein, partial [Acinetobacter sp.]|uniref:hypothetical protein n=1 Tax=Acinetobacter sp. TaxID=472 RepID=UPI003CFED735
MSELVLPDNDLAAKALMKLDDEELRALRFTMPWQTNEVADTSSDADGFSGDMVSVDREKLQQACWDKFNKNPQISTAVKGHAGRLAGFGFEVSCEIEKIQEVFEEIEYDPRNRLYTFWPKFVARSHIEGELYLCLTLHDSGFIEVDFVDPSDVTGGGDDGVVYHPTKVTMPLYYYVRQNTNTGSATTQVIPSIFIARYPELAKLVPDNVRNGSQINDSRSTKTKFKKIGGYRRFIVSWDKSYITKRNVSHLRTILEWLNHYENLKKYEIDHKKSAGSYLWVVTMEDPKTFRTWLGLSDEERRKTGIMAKKTPGGTMVLPPGMKLQVMNPSLPSISESDTDIFHMITAGLDEPEDITSGQAKGTYSSVKASRGPMSDRISDDISYFEKFLRHDFWGSIFFLKTMITGFPAVFDQRQAVGFKNQVPVFKNVKKRPEFLLEISFPTSEVIDSESRARAYLGVKHGSTYDVLGIPNQEIAKKLGFGNYRKMRLLHATEMEKYPELALSVDQSAIPGQDPNENKKGED